MRALLKELIGGNVINHLVPVAATVGLLIAKNEKRGCVIISTDTVATIWITPNQGDPAGTGIRLGPNTLPLLLRATDEGYIAMADLYASATGGTPTISVVEVL